MSNTIDQLKSELNLLIENSKLNETIVEKLFQIETEVLACQSSEQLLKILLNSIKEKFSLSGICLLQVTPSPIHYLANNQFQPNWTTQNTQLFSAETLSHFHRNNKPYLTNQLENVRDLLPKNMLSVAKSIALTPLIIEGKLFGSLLFVDSNRDRFDNQLGTFHLEQLSVRVSLCLSNVLVREQLEYMANYDRLTGVANRRSMEVHINEELIRHKRYQVPFSLLFIDCNKFKRINDTYGHDCGDKVLAYVASSLKELIRENDRCFRFAGDEFVVVLANQNYQEAVLASKRLCHFFINNPMPYEQSELPITISCGAATSDGVKNMDELLKSADQQLYLHKDIAEKDIS